MNAMVQVVTTTTQVATTTSLPSMILNCLKISKRATGCEDQRNLAQCEL